MALDDIPADPTAPQVEAHLPPGVVRGPETVRAFRAILVNTLVANVTSGYLWFALVFWAYLETRSVLATAFLGGSFMLLMAVCGVLFGTLVDRHKKKTVMVTSTLVTLVAYALAGVMWWLLDKSQLIDWSGPWFWLFAAVILVGGVIEGMRNIALSTTVTLLVPEKERPNANGLVGAVQGVAFMLTSALAGLSVGLLGMTWTLVISIALTAVSMAHLLPIRIPELKPEVEVGASRFDIRGAVTAIMAVPGLLALILFSTFNNLVGGVYAALMDPYGLTLFSVEAWGVIFGLTGLGFVIGGSLVARFGLGSNPVRTLLLVNLIVAGVGIFFAMREWAWLYVLGLLAYMCVFPAAEAAEQTIMQRVVPFRTQGRVFGFAQSVELAASPISAFLIGPIAEFWLIPYMERPEGQDTWGWLVGAGEARGIALVFIASGLIMLVTVTLALMSAPYRRLSRAYAEAPPQAIDATG